MQNNKDAFGPLMIAISNDLRIEIGPGIPQSEWATRSAVKL